MGRGLQAWADYSYADRLHAITHHHPDPLVPRRRTHGVTERIDQFGDVIIPLYEHEVVTAAQGADQGQGRRHLHHDDLLACQSGA